MLTVLIPVHKDAEQLAETLESVFAQTTKPDRTVVIANNYDPQSGLVETAQQMGAEVLDLPHCSGKKAGALNAWFDLHLSACDPEDHIMVMDADSILHKDFLTNAISYLGKGYAACGGVFTGKAGGGFVGMLQRNEYARYAIDVKRKKGKTLVLTGTATLFTVRCLRSVVSARHAGVIPRRRRGKHGFAATRPTTAHVYDTKVLTEDNELTFALLHLRYKIIAPAECQLQTEVMTTWRALWKQRHRWKRGAIENNVQYGLTRYTAKYWGMQVWAVLGILVTIFYLTTTAYDAATWNLHFYKFWLGVTAFFCIDRVLTITTRGWKQMLLASTLLVEMVFDIFLQAVHLKAFGDAIRRAEKAW